MAETWRERMDRWYRDMPAWDKGLPADLIPAIKGLRETFEDEHSKIVKVTEKWCYGVLHNKLEDLAEYAVPLQQIKAFAGPLAAKRFDAGLKGETGPSYFAAFFNLYLTALGNALVAAFNEFLAVGEANPDRLPASPISWTNDQATLLIREGVGRSRLWIQNSCDESWNIPIGGLHSDEEWWPAPRLITMVPARNQPYQADKVWERLDIDSSESILIAHEDTYRLSLKSRLKACVNAAWLEAAKSPPSTDAASSSKQNAVEEIKREPSTKRKHPAKQQLYARWKQKCAATKKTKPNMTDRAIAALIAKSSLAEGSSAETIRKHMK